MKADLLILHANSLCRITDSGGPRRGAAQSELDIIHDGALAVAGERIVAVGTTAEVLAAWDRGSGRGRCRRHRPRVRART